MMQKKMMRLCNMYGHHYYILTYQNRVYRMVPQSISITSRDDVKQEYMEHECNGRYLVLRRYAIPL